LSTWGIHFKYVLEIIFFIIIIFQSAKLTKISNTSKTIINLTEKQQKQNGK